MDFSKICRSCNSEKTNLLNLFANDCDDEPTLGEKFLICTPLDLQEADEYPQNICYSCAKQLEIAYKFRKQCERSFNQLQQKLNSIKKQLPRKVIKVENAVEKVVDTTPEIYPIFIDDNNENPDVPASRICKSNSNQLEPSHLPDPMPISIKVEDETSQVDNYESNDEDVFMTGFESNIEILDQPETVTDVSITAIDRRYQCTHCDKSFLTWKGFDLHLKLTHKNIDLKPENSPPKIVKISPPSSLVCSVCNIEMASIDDLRMHRIIEHNEQTMKCNICGVQIRTRIAYKKHLLTHYTNKPYDCQVCGKQYTEYRYLYRHMLYHKTSNYKCMEARCGKTFIVKHKYIDHLRMFHYKQLSSDQVRNIQPVEDE